MDPHELKNLAAQLRKPTGEEGIEIGDFMNRGNRQMHRDTYSVLDLHPNDKVLEIGMGNGFFINDLFNRQTDIDYTGCDYADVMIEEANRLNSGLVSEGKARFICAAAERIPFANCFFDKIVTINTLYFWHDANAVLREIRRVLDKKGLFVLAFRPERQMKNYPFTPFGFRLYAKEEALQLLVQAGFEPMTVYENQEPDFEIKGINMKVENTVIVCRAD